MAVDYNCAWGSLYRCLWTAI